MSELTKTVNDTFFAYAEAYKAEDLPRMIDLGLQAIKLFDAISAQATELQQLREKVEVLTRFYRAVRSLNGTLGHPEATAADEDKAEREYEAAASAASKALAQREEGGA